MRTQRLRQKTSHKTLRLWHRQPYYSALGNFFTLVASVIYQTYWCQHPLNGSSMTGAISFQSSMLLSQIMSY